MLTRVRGAQSVYRFLAFIGVVVLSVGFLAACGGGDDKPAATTVPAVEQPTEATIASPTVAAAAASPTVAVATEAAASPAGSPGASPVASPAGSPAAVAEGTIEVLMVDNFFKPNKASAAAGTVSFLLKNNGKQPHGFVIKSGTTVVFDAGIIAAGTEQLVSVDLAAGKYSYVDEKFRQQGMTGTLIVE